MNKRIGIIGPGNVGASLACILTAAGESPLVFHDANHPGVLKGGIQSITIYGKLEGTFHINQTTNFSEFSGEVDTVFVCTPSYAHEHIYRTYIPKLNANTVVINITGNFASIIYGENMFSKGITVADISLSPIGARFRDNKMNLICIKKSIMVGALNRDIAQRIKDRVQRYLPWKLLVGTAIESGLNNLAGICHPAMLIFNAGRIGPDKEDYYFNKEGITPEIATFIERLDNERMGILSAMGFEAKSLPKIMHNFYGEKFASVFDFFKGSSILNSGKLCPKKMRNRYIEEDIPDLLLPWLCLAKYLRLKHDAIETTIAASSLLLNENYFKRETEITAALLPMLAKHQIAMA